MWISLWIFRRTDYRSNNYLLNSSYEILKVSSGRITAGSSITDLLTLNCQGKSTITFIPKGYGNYGDGVIRLSVYGGNIVDIDKVGNTQAICTDRVLIQNIDFVSGNQYSINIAGYNYVSFGAINNNDAYAMVDLFYVTLS